MLRFTLQVLAKSSNFLQNVRQFSTTEPPLLVEVKNKVQWIRLNRPKQYNAMNTQLYQSVIGALNQAEANPEVRLTLITGNGPFFSSGNDLNNFTEWEKLAGKGFSEGVDYGCEVVERFVNAFIDFPKPLIAAVNGPAFGIWVTIFGLHDVVIASDTATFTAPFVSLGISPEGCSTYTFPRILGHSVASAMLYFSKTLKAEEALQRGLVSEVVPAVDLESYLEKWLYDSETGLVATCYPNSMMNAKALIRNEEEKRKLREVNKVECEGLRKMFKAPECRQALDKFFQRKK